MRGLAPFAFASLLPAVLLSAATLWGGLWAVAALASITVVVFVLDKLRVDIPVREATGHRFSEFLGLIHFPIMGLVMLALGSDLLTTLDKALIIGSAGLYFGQVSNSNAHELIHRKGRWSFRLGAANYTTLLFGHHTSAHRLVHHVHAATPLDPATARLGENYWSYLFRTWGGSFRAGLDAERKRRKARWPLPYVIYVAGAVATLALAFGLSGLTGLLGWMGIAFYANAQLMLSDYVQHYGLMRSRREDGSYEPIGPAHSWNAPHWYSSVMMLNAPRHSDHHMSPGRAFPALELDRETMPMMPQSLPIMAVIALFPPFWRNLMDHRVARWQAKVGETVPLAAE